MPFPNAIGIFRRQTKSSKTPFILELESRWQPQGRDTWGRSLWICPGPIEQDCGGGALLNRWASSHRPRWANQSRCNATACNVVGNGNSAQRIHDSAATSRSNSLTRGRALLPALCNGRLGQSVDHRAVVPERARASAVKAFPQRLAQRAIVVNRDRALCSLSAAETNRTEGTASARWARYFSLRVCQGGLGTSSLSVQPSTMSATSVPNALANLFAHRRTPWSSMASCSKAAIASSSWLRAPRRSPPRSASGRYRACPIPCARC